MEVTLAVLLLLGSLGSSTAYTDPECRDYDHQKYGCTGQCVSTTSCPGGKYISKLCPTQAADIKCCFTTASDEKCASYDHSSHGQVGQCISTSACPDDTYISNLCPTKPAGVKCCFRKPRRNACSVSGLCSATVQSLARRILNNPRIKLLDNNKLLNPAGDNDGADAKSNIRDTCDGKQAKISSYCCSSGCAPGGWVCLSDKALTYLLDLANAGHSIVTGPGHPFGE